MGRLSRQRVTQTRQRATKEAHSKFGSEHPLDTFFSAYDDFAYNPDAPSGLEYCRLRRKYKWQRGDAAGEIAWQDFRTALVLEFNARFGTDIEDLLAWQTLCVIVGVEGVDDVEDWGRCEELLRGRLYNLVDVVDAHRRGKGEVVRNFATAGDLEEYTKRTGAFFPRGHMAAGGLLRRVLWRPSNVGIEPVADTKE